MSAARPSAPSSCAWRRAAATSPARGTRQWSNRDRELARLHENLGELAASAEAGRASIGDPADEDEDDDGDRASHVEELRQRILAKLERLRRREMVRLLDTPEKREAWVVLYGPEELEAIESTENSEQSRERHVSYSRDACPDRTAGDGASSSVNPSDGEGEFTSPKQPSSSQDKPGPRLRRI